ncbi:hypothetical protein K3X41_13260 [Aliiroseovarius crassostreae]|uniref:hypothetical protein n=1 Tax=Aliiroseovarius crassostreae TaxID=154981 RepID=UPI00220A513F|nr:hypothetical protein [Aliiroseovarius crassostreae]UWQ10819.1 hypothetical protein K3X41_13260 [Aliiroseovarius crassostreae]
MLLNATTSQAGDHGLKDVKGWLDGCVALAPTDGPMVSILELDCFSAAVRYCEVGRTIEFRDPCRSTLATQLSNEIAAIRPHLKPAEGMKVYRQKLFERELQRLDQDIDTPCPDDVTEIGCELVHTGLKWLKARSLAKQTDGGVERLIHDSATGN